MMHRYFRLCLPSVSAKRGSFRKELFHREAVRRGELQNDEMSAGYEYAAHFGQSFIQSVKVTDAERHGHGIEAFIDKRERGAVLPDKGNPVREVRLFYFFTSHIHHAFGYVGPDEHIGLQFAAGKYVKSADPAGS